MKLNLKKHLPAILTGSLLVDKFYESDHSIIKRQLILVENCDLEVIDDAYELWEYLDMDYELYLVCPTEEEYICQ